MTSREALNDLRERIIHPEYFGQREILNELAIIEKDLEVLECFKKLFEGEDLDGWIEFNFYVDIPYINKIKEWLGNDK